MCCPAAAQPAPKPAAGTPKPVRHRYGDRHQQFGDLYLPASGTPRGTVVVVHGGFWQSMYALDLGAATSADLAKRGWAAWNIEYRRVGRPYSPIPGHPLPSSDIGAGTGSVAGPRLALMTSPTPRTLLAVDGNSLLHRSFHASARTGFRTSDGRPAWAVRGLLSHLTRCRPVLRRRRRGRLRRPGGSRDASAGRSTRRSGSPSRRPWSSSSTDAVGVLRDLGVVVAVPPGLEADDVLASAAAYARGLGACTVVATSDRDSFALVAEDTRMLRILNGGVEASPMLDPRRLQMVTGVRPDQYLDFAALRGDSSDNLPGVSASAPRRRPGCWPSSAPRRPPSTTPG